MTSAEPWTLTTAPGTSGYTMYRDPDADPPALVCQVGKTTLRYHLSAVEDLHAWLLAQGDWVPLRRRRRAEARHGGHRRGVGPLGRQPGRRLVRPAQGLPGPLRDVPAAAAGAARPGRAHPRRPQQQGPRAVASLEHGRRHRHRPRRSPRHRLLLRPRAVHRRAMGPLHHHPAVRRRGGAAGRRPTYWERAELCVAAGPAAARARHRRRGHQGLRRAPAMSPMACGLVHMELHRGDGSLGTFLGVHAGLAMQSIAMCGSEEQKARWLPAMATMDKLGAFALTEPDHGSDSVALETTARRGRRPLGARTASKRWIGNGTRRRPRRRLGPRHRGRPGQGLRRGEGHRRATRPRVIDGQGVAARGVAGRHHAARRAGARRRTGCRRRSSFKDTGRVLATTRNTCAWVALGHATAAYDAALDLRAASAPSSASRWSASRSCRQRLVQMLAEADSHAAVLPAARPPRRGGQAHRHRRRAWRR